MDGYGFDWKARFIISVILTVTIIWHQTPEWNEKYEEFKYWEG
jgi:hypothetical protein